MVTVTHSAPPTSLTASTDQTIVQVTAPSTIPVKILEVSITGNGTDPNAAPIEAQLLRQSAAPTATAIPAADLGVGEVSGASPSSTGNHTFDSEPTDSDILRRWYFHPQTGFIWNNPEPGRLLIPAGEKVGLKVISPSAISVLAYIVIEE